MKKKASGNNRCRPYYRDYCHYCRDEDSGTFLLFQREDGPECILWFGNGGRMWPSY